MSKGLFGRVMNCVLLFVFLILPAHAQVHISYTLEESDSGRWKATYELGNLGYSPGIQWFTIFFDYGLYDHLVAETSTPIHAQWQEEVKNPLFSSPLPFPGIYDSWTTFEGISPGQFLTGFTISFDWLGEGAPTRGQQFEVYANAEEPLSPWGGTTVYIPEPATLLVLSVGSLFAFGRYGKRYFC